MTAKELFKGLGYEQVEETNKEIIYEKILGDCSFYTKLNEDERLVSSIEICKKTKYVEVLEFIRLNDGGIPIIMEETKVGFDFKLAKAIYQQLKELEEIE